MRALNPALEAALDDRALAPALFVHVECVTQSLRMWSGLGAIDWNGHTWLGAGELGAVENIGETTDVRAIGLRLTLSGVPQDQISLALQEMASGKPVEIWFGLLNSQTGAVIADPDLVFSGLLDVPTIDDGARTATITITVESVLAGLEQPNIQRWTHENQQRLHPGDRGFEHVAALQDKEVLFG